MGYGIKISYPRPPQWRHRSPGSIYVNKTNCVNKDSPTGSLRNNHGDCDGKVTGKVMSRCFRLSTSFNLSNVGNLYWSWILKGCMEGQENKKKIVVFCSRPQDVKLVVQWRQRNVQKSAMHVQSCCFANLNLLPQCKPNINLLLFCRSRWRRCPRCSSSLMAPVQARALLGIEEISSSLSTSSKNLKVFSDSFNCSFVFFLATA